MSIIYQSVRPIAAIALKVFFRKIYFVNRDRIPIGKPLILSINHPSAFIEPCLCACYLPMPLHFLVRGNLFAKPVYRKLLNFLHMVPIYRKQEGYDQLKKNDSTFDFCFKALNDRKTIVILPEGKTIQEKRLRPLHKGMGRIAFGTYEKYGDIDLHIVPIGVNYTYANRFRSVVMLDVGKPILIRDYLEAYQENPQRTIRNLTEEVKVRMENHLIIIDKKEDEPLTEDLFVLYRNEQKEKIFPIISEDQQPFLAEKQIGTAVNKMTEPEKQEWKNQIKKYFSLINNQGISDFGIINPGYHNNKNTLFFIIGFIPFLIGYLGNYFPLKLGKYISDQRVKQLEFKAPVALAVALGSYPVYWILLFILALNLGNIFWVVLVLLLPFLGRFTLIYKELYQKWSKARKAKKVENSILQQIKSERKIISQKLNKLISKETTSK